ncbi:MAG: hypothetical protein RL518_2433 [Pseudomonadota bacterium]|jgi:hypothetical protein
MGPQIQQARDARQDQREERFDLGKVVAPVLQAGLELYSFGLRSQAVRDLFLEQPEIFRGMNVADGTNLPNVKNVMVAAALEERSLAQAA